MKLSTPVNIRISDFKINHQPAITLMGSCFAESIGEKLAYHKFNVQVNPFGIIYNPVSLAKSISRIIEHESYSEKEIIHFNEKWLSLDHHSSFSKPNKADCLNEINQSLMQAHDTIKESKTLIVTFGSAWAYEYKNFGIVTNCHKIPAKEFTKRLLSVKEIIAVYEKLTQALKTFNPELKILFTVSPVRHSKDGLYENNLSKSTLHLAINNLVEQHQNCSYFPAYEIVVDELRDYRFYKDDLVHPTELAVNYVWEKFSDCYFSENTKQLNIEIAKIQSALAHKPFNTKSEKYKQFVSNTDKQIKELQSKFSFLEF